MFKSEVFSVVSNLHNDEVSLPPVSRSMPVLERLKRIFQTEFGHDFAKLPNRHTTLFVMVQHGFVTIRPMMDAFLELGIPSKNVFMTTKPHTTSPEMLAYFEKTFASQYIPFQWSAIEPAISSSNAKEMAKPSRYKRLTTLTHNKLFEAFCDSLLGELAPDHIHHIIICDEGGKFLNEFIKRYHNPDNRYSRKLSDYHVVAIEHTKCGTYGEALGHLPFPLINMADSYLKTQIESEFIAKSMFVNLNAVLARITLSPSVIIGVIGGGNIGSAVLHFLLKEYSSISIKIYDQEPGVLSSSKILEQGWQNVSRAESIELIFQQATVILGCTGKDITDTQPLHDFVLNQENHIHLISCSSGDVEFHTLLQQMPHYRFESLDDICDLTMVLNAEKKKALTIYNGGFPMNFLVEQPAEHAHRVPAPESVPVEEIQITRGMKLAAIVQALKLLEVTPYISNEYSLVGYMQLDVLYQWEIIQAFYEDLMKTNSTERKVLVQEKYSNITKQKIAQSSVGASQPSMSSVLRIPHYITTNYQVKLAEKLEFQKTSIKYLVIHGTAGSGKTTLAQHYSQKHRIQFPEHLSRVLLAETLEQWRSSLRECATDLFPNLTDLLKNEHDPQQQEHLIDQYIQKALRNQEWCIVIDNWDRHSFSITEIERLFLHQDSRLKPGTLLITTQGQSPVESIHSIDLSNGLAPEESQELLTKVMNLEEEMGINWEILGTEAEMQALTKLLNHLPLAVVIAGSYLMWENKHRQRESQPLFTYHDYQTMLDQKVTELMKIYDEELSTKGRVPRDQTREEFKRLKTQEAAVDLSLKKAIQTESENPNMNLWQMLCFCGFLASDRIPQQLLKDYIAQILPEDEREIYETFFETLLNEAQNYSLLQIENNQSAVDSLNSLHMHRVIQNVLRDKYFENLILKIPIATLPMSNAIGAHFSPATHGKIFPIIREYMPHLESWFMYRKKGYYKKDFDFLEIHLQNDFGLACRLIGNEYRSENLFQELLASIIHYFPTSHVAIGMVERNLANTWLSFGRYHDAEKLHRTALTRLIAHHNAEAHIDVAMAQDGLAGSLLLLGRYDEAAKLDQTALTTYIAHYGTKIHIQVAMIQENLANSLKALNRYEEAEALQRTALNTLIAHYDTEIHIDVAMGQANLALTYGSLYRHHEAETLQHKALATLIAHYHTDVHVVVAKIQKQLANTLIVLGHYDKAEKLLRTALTTYIAFYNDTHIEVAIVQQSLAYTLGPLGQHREAALLCEKALEIQTIYYGTKKHMQIAMTQYTYALAQKALKNFSSALNLACQCEKILEIHIQGDSCLSSCRQLKIQLIAIINSLPKVANEALASQNYEIAIICFENLIAQNPTNVHHYNNCARVYHFLALKQEKIEFFDKAKKYFLESLKIKGNINTKIKYANFLRTRGCYSEAITFLNEALAQPISSINGLFYDFEETLTLPLALAEKIKSEGAVAIHHPQFFVYYLKIECLVAAQASTEEIETCLVQFTNALMNFYQTYSEEPLYDWFLENAYTFQEENASAGASLPFFDTKSSALNSSVRQEKANNP